MKLQEKRHPQARGECPRPLETGGAHSSFREEPTLPTVCLWTCSLQSHKPAHFSVLMFSLSCLTDDQDRRRWSKTNRTMLGNAGSGSESRCFISMLPVSFCKLDEKEKVRGDVSLNSVGSGEGRAGASGLIWGSTMN